MIDLRIEITEEEILADLTWPGPPPGRWPVPPSDREDGSAESAPAPSNGRRTALV
jgi:hypothetical protein